MFGVNRWRPRETVITRADRAVRDGDLELALRLYRQALERTPRNGPIWVQCGHILKDTGRLQEAEAAYRRASSCDAQAADPYLHLGHALKLQGRNDEALNAYVRALTIEPFSSEAARELASLGWGEERLSHFRQSALSRAAANPTRKAPLAPKGKRVSIITLADKARDRRDWASAAPLYRTALERNPRNAPIWVQFGHALKETGDLAGAEGAYRKAIACGPLDPEPWLLLGDIGKRLGRSGDAEAAYLRAFALNPSLAAPLNGLRGQGWPEAAVGELQMMVGSAPADEPATQDDTRQADAAAPEISEQFDREWYLERYPDVAHAGIDPLRHFVEYGASEGRAPNAMAEARHA